MIRWDDYPAYFAEPSLFWEKTLHEGRWINYVWHLREIVTPAWLNFAVYQLLWAVFAASIAVTALRHTSSLFFTIVLALLILVSPPATLISLWFNTLLPGLALVAGFALLGCFVSAETQRRLMPLFIILSFLAYTTYPLLILAACVVRPENHTIRNLGKLGLSFVLSFACGILAAYTLNYLVHGVFGIPLADWRSATPTTDLPSLQANLAVAWASLSELMVKASFGFKPAIAFHLLMLFGGTLVLLRRAPVEAIGLSLGLWLGLALVVVQVLKTGALVPPRGFIFAWVFYALIVTRAAQELAHTPAAGRMAKNLVLLIVGSYLLQTFSQYIQYRDWQAETRALATQLRGFSEQVALRGEVLAIPSARAAHVQNALALNFRLRQLGAPTVILCSTGDDRCVGHPFEMEVQSGVKSTGFVFLGKSDPA